MYSRVDIVSKSKKVKMGVEFQHDVYAPLRDKA